MLQSNLWYKCIPFFFELEMDPFERKARGSRMSIGKVYTIKGNRGGRDKKYPFRRISSSSRRNCRSAGLLENADGALFSDHCQLWESFQW